MDVVKLFPHTKFKKQVVIIMKKTAAIFAAFIVSVIFFTIPVSAHELKPTRDFFVNDFANVIPEEVENQILETGIALEEKTTAQLVLVTVENIGENDIFDYSLSLARDWGIGTAETSNGCLIFLSINDRKSFVQVGYGLEGCLTDGKTGELQDNYLVPYMANKEYGSAAVNIYNAIAEEIYTEYSIEVPAGLKVEKRPMDTPTKIFLAVLLLVGIAGAAFFIWAVYKGVTSPDNRSGDNYRNDHHSSRGHGGGFSGGGSSGGGGSFGGGGSGRSW